MQDLIKLVLVAFCLRFPYNGKDLIGISGILFAENTVIFLKKDNLAIIVLIELLPNRDCLAIVLCTPAFESILFSCLNSF